MSVHKQHIRHKQHGIWKWSWLRREHRENLALHIHSGTEINIMIEYRIIFYERQNVQRLLTRI